LKTSAADAAGCTNLDSLVGAIHECSPALCAFERDGRIAIAGAKYDVLTGRIDFLSDLPKMNRIEE
jgi:hypothetical protein